MDVPQIESLRDATQHDFDDDAPSLRVVDILTWIGEGKRLVAAATLAAAALSLAVAFLLTPIFTARTTLLAPPTQQQGGSAAALAALGALGGLAGGLGGGLGVKTPDDLYIALLKSDSVVRALDQRFGLRDRFRLKNH